MWLVLVGMSVGSIAFVYGILGDHARAGAGLPAFSVYSDGPDGFAQAGALLSNLGWQPVPVTRPIQQTHHRGLLILAEPRERLAGLGNIPMLTDADADGLLDWVRQGNTLLFLSPRDTQLSEKLGVFINDAGDRTTMIFQGTPAAGNDYMDRVDHIGIERPSTIGKSKAVPLWFFGKEPAAVLVRHGAGRVLLVADPLILTHRGLRREDNAIFLYNVASHDAQEGRVYFDEYHHGIRSGGGYWSYLRYHGQHWVVLQLVLIAAIAVWAVGRRLGPAVTMPVTRRADGVDYASSVARIYEKADVRPLVAGIYARHFLTQLTVHLRLRRTALQGDILTGWRARYGDEGTRELSRLLNAADDLHKARVASSAQLLTLAQEFDGFLKEHVR
jgi:hypothetical protein